MFPRVSLDLPRLPDSEGLYSSLEQEARSNLAVMLRKQQHLAALKAGANGNGEVEEELMKLVNVDENGVEVEEPVADVETGANAEPAQVGAQLFSEILLENVFVHTSTRLISYMFVLSMFQTFVEVLQIDNSLNRYQAKD